VVGGALFVAGTSTAVGFSLASHNKDTDAKALLTKVGLGGCAPGNAAASANATDCAALLDLAQSKDRYANLATAGIVVAAGALAATAVYWFWPRPNSRANASSGHVNLGMNVWADGYLSRWALFGEF
jgi:hypothetical protein